MFKMRLLGEKLACSSHEGNVGLERGVGSKVGLYGKLMS